MQPPRDSVRSKRTVIFREATAHIEENFIPLVPMSTDQASEAATITSSTDHTTSEVSTATLLGFTPNSAPEDDLNTISINTRQAFLLFIKILFRYLRCTRDRKLQRRVKALVRSITAESRLNDAEYMPLPSIMIILLQSEVGLIHWEKAEALFKTYCRSQRIRVD